MRHGRREQLRHRVQGGHAGSGQCRQPGQARDRDPVRSQGNEERHRRGEDGPGPHLSRRHEAQGGARHPAVQAASARHRSEGAHHQGPGARGGRHLAPARHPAGRHSHGEGQGDRAGHQGLKDQGPGLHPGEAGARLRKEPGRSPGRHRAGQVEGFRHRAPVHQLPLDVMARLLAAVLAAALLPWWPTAAAAQSLNDIFRKAVPGVVVIRAKGRDVSSAGVTRFNETGSGVMISADGKVMTAAHVVNAMDEITVEAIGGERVSARVVSSEPAADLSLLQLDKVPASLRAAKMADSDTVKVGDQVMIIGAPFGLSYSMSAGWISARWPPNTVYRNMPLAEFFQTTATINTGNSGGPMYNMAAEVIGIVSHNISKSGGSEGLGFVVTINTARKLLLEKPSFWSGIEGIMLSGDLAAIFNVTDPPAFLVRTVAKGSAR